MHYSVHVQYMSSTWAACVMSCGIHMQYVVSKFAVHGHYIDSTWAVHGQYMVSTFAVHGQSITVWLHGKAVHGLS